MIQIDNNNLEQDESRELFNKIKNLAKESYRLIGIRKFQDAEEKLHMLLSLDPDNTYGLVGLGDVYFKTRKYNQAIRYYLLCLEKDPSNKFSLMGLMNSYRETNQLDKVISAAEDYRHITMQDASILSRVADAHRKMKNFAESEVFYKSALQVNPNDQYVLVGLGHLFFARQEYEKAIEWWEKVLEKQKRNIKIMTEIGNAYRKMKKYPQALDFYKMATEIEPDNFFALYGMAETYRADHDFVSAVEYWEKILEHDPNNKLIINRYADSLRGMGEYEKALECFDRILEKEHDYFAMLGKASSLRSTGKEQEAVEIYLDLKEKFPEDPKPVLEIADILICNDQTSEGIQLLQNFHNSHPSNQEIGHKLEDAMRNHG